MAARGGRPAGGPPPERPSNVLVLNASSTSAEVHALCERLPELIDRHGSEPLIYDVAAVADPDAATVEALARLQLAAVRLGRRVRFVNARDELHELIALAGLGDVLPCDEPPCGPTRVDPLRVEPFGQAEQREQALRVEEERDPGDPSL